MSLYGYSVPVSNSTVTMSHFLCTNYIDDPCECIDCKDKCAKGEKAVEKLEKDTKKIMTKKERTAATLRVTAMSNYLEAMSAPDPVKFVQEKYGSETERVAKNKIYQWQHNYGTNLRMVADKISLLKEEICLSEAQANKSTQDANKPEIAEKTPDKPAEEKKMTKRQEEKFTQSHLEKMRAELEAEYLKAETEIEEHKKGIAECEKQIEGITEKIKAIRSVLEIFKEKDTMYV